MEILELNINILLQSMKPDEIVRNRQSMRQPRNFFRVKLFSLFSLQSNHRKNVYWYKWNSPEVMLQFFL